MKHIEVNDEDLKVLPIHARAKLTVFWSLCLGSTLTVMLAGKPNGLQLLGLAVVGVFFTTAITRHLLYLKDYNITAVAIRKALSVMELERKRNE